MKKECFFREKKRFHFFKSLLYKIGQAQNMPVVAGRLILSSVGNSIPVIVSEHNIVSVSRKRAQYCFRFANHCNQVYVDTCVFNYEYETYRIWVETEDLEKSTCSGQLVKNG